MRLSKKERQDKDEKKHPFEVKPEDFEVKPEHFQITEKDIEKMNEPLELDDKCEDPVKNMVHICKMMFYLVESSQDPTYEFKSVVGLLFEQFMLQSEFAIHCRKEVCHA